MRKSSENTINIRIAATMLCARGTQNIVFNKEMEPSLQQQAKKPVSQYSATALNRNAENRQAIFLGFVGIFFPSHKDYRLLFL